MKNFKNIIATFVLIGGLSVTNTFAEPNKGLIVSDLNGNQQQCSETTVDWLTGILLNDLMGIIYSDLKVEGNTNCE
jgi:hypothetical protein